MIRYIKGRLVMAGESEVIVENQGIGYRILVPATVSEQLPARGSEVMLYTYFNVREDAMQLFGFLRMNELEMFERLITVSGIGPKGGLSILGVLSVEDIRYAVLSEDAKTISKAPGVGPKTARRLIVELKDKMDLAEELAYIAGAAEGQEAPVSGPGSEALSEAVQALEALGYSRTEALKAVGAVPDGDKLGTEELLKQALRNL